MFIASSFILGNYIKYLKIAKKNIYYTLCRTLSFISIQYIYLLKRSLQKLQIESTVFCLKI